MPDEEDATALISKADQWIKDTRQFANAIQDSQTKNAIVKVYQIIEFQNQALEKLRQKIDSKSD
jgi:hypothetical protein